MPLYRGQGGAVFEIDPPESGQARETFDAQVASGAIALVAEPVEDQPKPRKAAAVKDQ